MRMTKAQVAERDSVTNLLHHSKEALDEAIEEFNTRMQELFCEIVDPAVEKMNEALGNAEEWIRELHDSIDAFMQERSGKWLESPAGQAHQAWLDSLDEIGLDDVVLDVPQEVETPLIDPASAIQDIPESPEGGEGS